MEFLASYPILSVAWAWIIANIENLTTFVLGINVFLCACNNKWNWPIGILGVTMYGLSAWFLWGLYADAVLQIFYFITGFVGWYYWAKGGVGKTEAPVTALTEEQIIGVIGFVAAVTAAFYFLLSSKTDSVVPFLDAYTTAMSLMAQILLMYRKRFAWVLWIMANVAYVYMFHVKGLDSLSYLYIAFILNAGFGWYKWTCDKNTTEKAALDAQLA